MQIRLRTARWFKVLCAQHVASVHLCRSVARHQTSFARLGLVDLPIRHPRDYRDYLLSTKTRKLVALTVLNRRVTAANTKLLTMILFSLNILS